MNQINSPMRVGSVFNDSSNLATSGQASSSKAVLTALRALQDKIRRLETEKAEALDETKQLRLKIQQQEIEFDHMTQNEKLNSQRSMSEARVGYETALTEKCELESRAAHLEERNRELHLQVEQLGDRCRSLEAERHDLEHRQRTLESRFEQLEMKLEITQLREKELTESLLNEKYALNGSRLALEGQLQRTRSDSAAAARERVSTERRMGELDELLSSLLQLNEALLARLGDSMQVNASLKKILGHHRKVSHMASSAASTHASRARSRSRRDNDEQPEWQQPVAEPKLRQSFSMPQSSFTSTMGLQGAEDAEIAQFQALLRMYRTVAASRSVDVSAPLKNKDKMKTTSANKRSNGNGGAPTNATDYADVDGEAGSGSNPELEQISDSAMQLSTELKASDLQRQDSACKVQPQSRPTSRSQSPQRLHNYLSSLSVSADRERDDFNTYGYSNFTPVVAQNPSYNHSHTARLREVVSTLEEEERQLKARYHALLQAMQVDPDPTGVTNTTLRLSEELVALTQQLRRKGDQLRALKMLP